LARTLPSADRHVKRDLPTPGRSAETHPAALRTVLAWLPGLSSAAGWPFRAIFLLTLVPGLLSVATMGRPEARAS
jgi:hypothetical protein